MSKQTNYNVGIYLRLSKDDERSGESLSIENQRIILMKYVSEQGWNIYDTYIDDGISGTDFNRPGVQRMLDDAKNGKINLIIVKDLSRFGRNYIHVGQYIDYIFPMYNIRFIALNDNIDTADKNSTSMDMMPIVNVFNEWHAANTSKKIKAVMDSTAKMGKYHASFAAYGYIKSNSENHCPIVDEYAAKVVRRIFEMRASGKSIPQIAKALNADNIPTPSDYMYQRLGKPNPFVTMHLWVPCSVRRILGNPIYLGKLAQQRETTVSYKNHKKIRKDESEWVVVENTHEPIITQELWDKVVEINNSVSRGTTTRKGEILPLCGLMYCADCGAKLKKNTTTHFTKSRGKYKLVGYVCNTYSKCGKTACTSHHILQKDMEEIVLSDIRSMIQLVLEDEETAKQKFLDRKSEQHEKQTSDDKRLLRKYEKRLAELETMIQKIYEDKLLGRVPEDFSLKMLNQYLDEQKSIEEKVDELKEKKNQADMDLQNVEKFISRLKKYIDVKELTREMCLELIEYIVVGARSENREFHIYYKFIDKQLADGRNLLLPQNSSI